MRHSDAPKSKLLAWIRFSEEEEHAFRSQQIAGWQWLIDELEEAERFKGQRNGKDQSDKRLRKAS